MPSRLDDTAIPHIKIKITEIPLEKSGTHLPLYTQIDLYIFYYMMNLY